MYISGFSKLYSLSDFKAGYLHYTLTAFFKKEQLLLNCGVIFYAFVNIGKY